MDKPKVVLEQERDFTDVINVTFSFITQEYKLLLKVVLLYAGLPIIVSSVVAAYYSGNTITEIFSLIKGEITHQQPDLDLMALMYLTMAITMAMISGLTAAYIDEYKIKGHRGFQAGDVWNNFISKAGEFILLIISVFFLLIFGFGLCLVPGIYLIVPLSFCITVLYVEKTNFSQSFKRSFSIVKDNWWRTFGLIIVVGLIVSILSSLFSIPAMIIMAVQGFLVATGESSGEVNTLPVILTTVIGGIGQYIIIVISYVAIAIQYFNLKEKRDKTSLFKMVSEIANE